MKHADNIFLVGPMGAGKSTIGRKLAAALDKPFWDSDQEIEQRTGVDIPTIFEFEQEAGFRERERVVIDELTRKHGIVLATGGGAVLNETNRNNLKTRGLVIYLRASLEQLIQRTRRDRKRPLLQTEDPAEKLRNLMHEREPLYEEVADIVINTDRANVRSVAQRILKRLQARQGADQ